MNTHLLDQARQLSLEEQLDLVEAQWDSIAEWESAEAREVHLQESATTGAYAPLLEMLATPVRATVIRQLP